MKEQKKKVMAILSERLNRYGFKKRGYEYFVREVDKNTIQNIGLVVSTYEAKYLHISPSPGIVYRDVDRLEIQLRNLRKPKYPDYVGAMICLPVGYLMPENNYKEWVFLRDENVDEQANAMADAIITYGIPYMEKLANRDEVTYSLEIGEYGGTREFTLPILHYLRDDVERAFECINQYIRKFSTTELEDYEVEILKNLADNDEGEAYSINNNTLNAYLEFADNFRKMVEAENRK